MRRARTSHAADGHWSKNRLEIAGRGKWRGGGGAEGRVLQILCASVEVCAEIWALVTQGQSKSCLHAEGKYASGRREGDGAGGMKGGG